MPLLFLTILMPKLFEKDFLLKKHETITDSCLILFLFKGYFWVCPFVQPALSLQQSHLQSPLQQPFSPFLHFFSPFLQQQFAHLQSPLQQPFASLQQVAFAQFCLSLLAHFEVASVFVSVAFADLLQPSCAETDTLNAIANTANNKCLVFIVS